MRTNIVVDDKLMEKARKISGLDTKKEIVAAALKDYIRNHSRKDLRDLKGKVSFRKDYNYKELRQSMWEYNWIGTCMNEIMGDTELLKKLQESESDIKKGKLSNC